MNLLQIYRQVGYWKKFENRSIFGEVMAKNLVSCFLTHGVVLQHVDLCCLYSYLRVSRRSFMAQILDGLRRSLVGIFVLSLRVASRAHTMRQRSAFNCPFLTLRNVSSCDKTKTGSTAWVTLFCNYSAPDRERSIVRSVSVSVCVYLSTTISSKLHVRSSPNIFSHVTYGHGSVLLCGVVMHYVHPVLWMTSYSLISQGCSTSPPSWSAVHRQHWAWL